MIMKKVVSPNGPLLASILPPKEKKLDDIKHLNLMSIIVCATYI